MSWNHVQGNGVAGSGISANQKITFNSPVSVGDLVMVSVATNGSISTVTDSMSNSYNLIKSAIGVSFQNNNFLYYSNIVSGSNSLQVSVTPTSATFMTIAIDDFTYNTTASLAGNSSNIVGSSTTKTASSGPISWTGNGLDYAAFTLASKAGSVSPNSGFTLGYFTDFNAGVNFGLVTEYKLNDISNSVSPSMSFTNAVPWSTVSTVFTDILSPTPTPTNNMQIEIKTPTKLLSPTNNLIIETSNINEIIIYY